MLHVCGLVLLGFDSINLRVVLLIARLPLQLLLLSLLPELRLALLGDHVDEVRVREHAVVAPELALDLSGLPGEAALERASTHAVVRFLRLAFCSNYSSGRASEVITVEVGFRLLSDDGLVVTVVSNTVVGLRLLGCAVVERLPLNARFGSVGLARYSSSKVRRFK